MFCHECGKELHEGADFCSNCGMPVRKSPETSEAANSAGESAIPEAVNNTETAGITEQTTDADGSVIPEAADNTEEAAAPGQPAEAVASNTAALPDLVLKKGKVVISGNELRIKGKHYIRKTGKKKFKKNRGNTFLPLESIIGTTMEHKKYGGRMFLTLLLLVCFAVGTFYSSQYSYKAYLDLNAPYQSEQLTALQDIMDLINNSGAKKLIQYQDSLEEKRADADALTKKLSELEKQQTEELLKSIYTDDRFDLDTFFNNSFFTKAYQEYLRDLLNAFKEDEQLNSWLNSYYETAKQYGGNYFLDTDLWIYNGTEDNVFSPDLDSVAGLMRIHYDLDLYEHVLYTGHIYITASDFMKEILSLPRYTVDGAIFANAYGGVPDASAMNVPGWSRSHYEEFWLYGADYYNIDTPMWLDYGLSSADFELDWNGLVNEEAFHAAYKNFMDKIAPGLPCYDMVSYHFDDGAYGGMGYDLHGKEATISDIVAAYADAHPDFLDEVKKQGVYIEGLTTSVDDYIAEAQAQLEELETAIPELEDQKLELENILSNADSHRQEYETLLADIENHTRELTYRLIFFASITFLCALAVLICLCKFFGFIKRPRHFLVISRSDLEYALNAKRYSKEHINALQERLPKKKDPQE